MGLKRSRCAHKADARKKATVAASLPEWGSIRGNGDDEDGNADGDKDEEAINMDYNRESFLLATSGYTTRLHLEPAPFFNTTSLQTLRKLLAQATACACDRAERKMFLRHCR